MAYNKATYNNGTEEEVIFDLSNDTVTPSLLLENVTAHNSNNEAIVGTIHPIQSINETVLPDEDGDATLNAEDVIYDNTTSGLAGTDVQTAIDNLDGAIDGIKTNGQLAWAIADGNTTATLRKSGSTGQEALSIVTNSGGGNTFNMLIDSGGERNWVYPSETIKYSYDSSTTISDLDDVECPSCGRFKLGSAVSPSGAEGHYFYTLYGNETYKILIVFGVTDGTGYLIIKNSTWGSWARFTPSFSLSGTTLTITT